MTGTTSIDPAIADFAARVRRSLDDLPEDEIEDLTEGLEADLSEKALDEDLGDPGEYAIELRSAAGLPARPPKTQILWSLAGLHLWRAAAMTRIRRHAIGAQVLDFAIALRPGWWILRAWAVFQVTLFVAGGRSVVSALPETPFRWLFFAGLTVLSVQWGRGCWLPHRLRVAKVLASTFAILALPFLLSAAASSAAWAYTESVNPVPEQFPAGLTRNGESITNVFAYDANGAPITGVQLFDQNGRPLSVKPPGGDFIRTSDATALVPTHGVTSGNGWNVFPLESIPLTAIDSMTGQPAPDATTTPAKAPFTRIQPLLTPAPLRDGSGVTPAPSTMPMPSGTAAPVPSRSPESATP